MNSRAIGISTGAQMIAATAPANNRAFTAALRAVSSRQLTNRMISVNIARRAAKVMSASAAIARKNPASAAFFGFGSRSVFNR
jgi:hypothetical protein